MTEGKQFWINKSKLDQSQWQESSNAELSDGQVRLAVKEFAFTANNITYAALGDMLQYWKFFPAGEGFGIIPVWGFADVVESQHSDFSIGERVYGYFPMGEYLTIAPGSVSSMSFVDTTEHRGPLPLVYNQYMRCANDPLYTQDTEALQMILRPLFTTAFLLDDFFACENFFQGEQLILSSASSKTAIGTAFALKTNRDARKLEGSSDYKIVGLTSAANRKFVEGLGIYDEVLGYDELASIKQVPSVFIDFAGNAPLKAGVHNTLTDKLLYSCVVGASHWDQTAGDSEPMAGPEPQMFFAPSQAQKRVSEWGPEGFGRRLTGLWQQFVQFTTEWIDIETRQGKDAISESYQQVLAGKLSPKEGLIYSINSDTTE